MHSVESIAAEIVRREGGYVNIRTIRAAPTNHGVTIHTMRRLGLDLTGDGKVNAADVRALIGHSVGSVVARTYDRGRRLARLRPLADAWGRRLEAIVAAPVAPAELRRSARDA